MIHQPLWVILCYPPEKGRREIVEKMTERNRGERKVNDSEETEEIKQSPSTLTCYKDSRPCPTLSKYQLDSEKRITDNFMGRTFCTRHRV